MSNDFNTTLAAMSAEEKVALLTGSGLWRTASLPQHGIEDIIMTDGTYGVRYSSAQIDGREKWSAVQHFATGDLLSKRLQPGLQLGRGTGASDGASAGARVSANGRRDPARAWH